MLWRGDWRGWQGTWRGVEGSTQCGGLVLTLRSMSTADVTMRSNLSGNRRRGDAHHWSRTLIPTAREAPSDAESVSHQLLVRGGFIRRVGAGIYSYLPLGLRVIGKVERIVREEMDAARASELLMPALAPIELLRKTGRDEAYGDNLFRLTDRHGRMAALAPTHEETITDFMTTSVHSYKQLPLNLYQIQTKFRDEFRPRSALLRGREFIMKDAYSFHLSVEGPGGLNETYDAMHRAYVNIFDRCGLDYSVVEAEAGPIGGSASHEFMVNCSSGEDTILRCPATGYAANVEKCEIGPREWSFDGEPTGELETVETPGMSTIEEVGKFLKVKPRNMLKTLIFVTEGEPKRFVVAVVRGDHEVNEGKVRDAAGESARLAKDMEAVEAGFAVGFVGPKSAVEKGALLLVDPDAAHGMDPEKGKPMFWASGADRMDHHVKHFNWRRELGDALDDRSRVRVVDLRNAMEGDPSPRDSSAKLESGRGIEVGHIFKLGTKYSDAMGFQILDKDQQRKSVIMGCYGIGVTRTVQACVEMSHDEEGAIWPAALAPYHVHIVPMKVEANSEHMRVAARLAGELAERGLDALIDDREERAGVKFKDADLIGCPVRLTIGDKSLAEGAVELKGRREGGKGSLAPIEEAVEGCEGMLG